MLQDYQKRLAQEGSVTLTVRARPGARLTKVVSVLDDGSLKIDVKAVPEDGAANEELVRFLADIFDVSTSSIAILSGQRGRLKVVRIG